MNIVQKIVLFFTFGFLLVGSLAFLFFSWISLGAFLLYFFFISVLGLLLCFALRGVSFHVQTKNDLSPQHDAVNPTLYSFRSVFPFDLFPDRYIIQEKTISIVRKYFFFSTWAETVPIKDIASVRLYAGPIFGSLVLSKAKGMQKGQTVELRLLWKKDALSAKEIIDGLILKENKIVSVPKAVSPEVKKDIVQELGHTEEVEKEI